MAKLVTTVNTGLGLHAFPQAIATENSQPFWIFEPIGGQT
jgi:hypothetical protein